MQANSSSSENITSSTDLDEIGYVPPLVSGNRIDFNVYILDQDGNIYTSDSRSKASLSGSDPLSSSSSDEDEDSENSENSTASSSEMSQ